MSGYIVLLCKKNENDLKKWLVYQYNVKGDWY